MRWWQDSALSLPGTVSKYSIVEHIVVDDGTLRYIDNATFRLAKGSGETLLGIKDNETKLTVNGETTTILTLTDKEKIYRYSGY